MNVGVFVLFVEEREREKKYFRKKKGGREEGRSSGGSFIQTKGKKKKKKNLMSEEGVESLKKGNPNCHIKQEHSLLGYLQYCWYNGPMIDCPIQASNIRFCPHPKRGFPVYHPSVVDRFLFNAL